MTEEPKLTWGGLFVDDRGIVRFINEFPTNIKRMYQVENLGKGQIRAFHGHAKEEKYVFIPKGIVEVKVIGMKESFSCLGGVWLGEVYIRSTLPAMPNREKIEELCVEYVPTGPADNITTFILSSDKPSILHIPKGYYNGFKTLTEGAIVQFFSTSTLEESKNDDHRLSWDYFGKEIWEENFR